MAISTIKRTQEVFVKYNGYYENTTFADIAKDILALRRNNSNVPYFFSFAGCTGIDGIPSGIGLGFANAITSSVVFLVWYDSTIKAQNVLPAS